MSRLHELLRAATPVLCSAILWAQNPTDAPPWWRVQDNVTVSLYWDFSGPTPLVPTQVTAPAWYNPAVTAMVTSGPLAVIPNLAGRTDVLGLVGNGTPQSASIDLTVDNDPHYNWVKLFFFQFDAFEGASGSIVEALEQDLAKYERSSMTTDSVALGNGWSRVTVTAQLVPQPTDEGIDFTFTETAFGNAAIDDLYVNSKCVKVEDADLDADGAFGDPDGFATDLTASTGAQQCIAAAVTESPVAPFTRTYWVSALAQLPGASHQVFRLNQSGAPIGVTLLPDTVVTAPSGPSDLAVETIDLGTGLVQQFVYAVLDLRTSPQQAIVIRAIDTAGSLTAARNVVVPVASLPANFPPAPHRFGLAFNPSGAAGAGTFWLTDQLGSAYEVSRTGAIRRAATNLPLEVVGAGYDEVFGNFYWFSSQLRGTPSGPVRTTGVEWSAYDLQPTGAQFFGNLGLPNPGTRGGVASGLDVYRRANGDFRAVCVVQMQSRSMLYELKGPFRHGQSLLGTIGMQGLPFEGSPAFQITLDGVPNAVFASLYAGFSTPPAPFSLAPFGLHESRVLIQLDLNSTLLTPGPNGTFTFPMPLPPAGSGLSYVPMFFQWVVFDPSVPNGITTSPAGKTVIY